MFDNKVVLTDAVTVDGLQVDLVIEQALGVFFDQYLITQLRLLLLTLFLKHVSALLHRVPYNLVDISLTDKLLYIADLLLISHYTELCRVEDLLVVYKSQVIVVL